MAVEVIAAILLIAVPIAFNLAFFELAGRSTTRTSCASEPDEILRRFAAGGAGLHPALAGAAAQRARDAAAGRAARRRPRRVAGPDGPVDRHRFRRGAGPGARPRPLAVRRAGAGPPLRRGAGRPGRRRDPARRSRSCSRRSIGCSASASASTSATCSPASGRCSSPPRSSRRRPPRVARAPRAADRRGAARSAPSSSSGPNERDGWPLAGTIVPIAYIAWSVWLIALGVLLLI